MKPGELDYRVSGIVAELRHRRRELGITQDQVADRLGLHRPSWSEVEAGRRHLLLEEYLVVCEYLGIIPLGN